MALFTDGSISTIGDLAGYESSILEVAKTERIDLSRKLKLAEEEIRVDLQAFLSRQDDTGEFDPLLNLTAVTPWWRIDQIVVTEPLHKWHTFRALSLTYRDAYNRQMNDRFQGKWTEYDALAGWASGALFETGVGMVSDPVPRAAQPQITTAAGTLAAATYFASVTWIGHTGAEGAPSELVSITVPANNKLIVTAVNPPAGVIGWNVYASYSAADLTLQNGTPVEASQPWIEPATGLMKGKAVGDGQHPETFLQQSERRLILRG
jgi:hypothetical protein